MSEHKGKTTPQGRFFTRADGEDQAFSNFRHFEPEYYWQVNARNPRTGKPLPRINHAKRAIRAAQKEGTAL